MSLRLRILCLVLIATLTPAIMLGVRRFDDRELELARAERSLHALATYAAENLADKTSGTVQLLHGLSRAPELEAESAVTCSAFLKGVLARYPQYTGILTITSDGQLYCDSLATGRTLDLRDRAYFKRASSSLDPVFDAVFGRLTGSAVLQVVYPVRTTNGNLKRVLLASLDLAQFARRIATASALQELELLIWDGKGTLLVRLPDTGAVGLVGGRYGESALYQFVRGAADVDAVELPGPDGTTKIWARSALPGEGGVSIAMGVPRDSLLAAANSQMRRELAFLAGVSLATFLVALLIAELAIRRQLARIMVSAKRQGAGALGTRIGGPFPRGELGELMQTLDATAAAVESQHAELERTSTELGGPTGRCACWGPSRRAHPMNPAARHFWATYAGSRQKRVASSSPGQACSIA